MRVFALLATIALLFSIGASADPPSWDIGATDALHLTGDANPNTTGCTGAPCDCSRIGKDRFTNTTDDTEWYCSATDTWTQYSGSGSGDMLKSTYDTDMDDVVDKAAALESNPQACTGTDFVNDTDADGSLTCNDPLSGRSVEELGDVNELRGSATGIIQTSIDESVTAGHAVCYSATGTNSSFTTCGQVPGGAANVEDHASACTSGQGFLSTGSAADCAEIATDAELNAIAAFGPTFQGETFYAMDDTWAGTSYEWDGLTDPTTPHILVEQYDALGHWVIRSQGDGGSGDWTNLNVACYEPPQTYRVWMNDYCAGATASPGRPCTGAGDCDGGSCAGETWNYGATPDTITITGHDFGATSNVWPTPFQIERGNSSYPVHNLVGSAAYPTCSPTISATDRFWIEVVDANTVKPYKDDGDLVEEVGGDDVTINCTVDDTDWQSFSLEPLDAAGNEQPHRFLVGWNLAMAAIADGGAVTNPTRCVGGGKDGQSCVFSNIWGRSHCTMTTTTVGSLGTCDGGNEGEWKRVTDGASATDCATGSGSDAHTCQCQSSTWTYWGERVPCMFDDDCYGSNTCTGVCDYGGICMNVVTPWKSSWMTVVGRLEGMNSDEAGALWGSYQNLTAHSSSEGNTSGPIAYANTSLVDVSPGECLTVLGYVLRPPQDDIIIGFDTLTDNGGQVVIAEAQRSSPERVPCHYASSATVPAACLYYGRLDNYGSSGSVTLTLPTLVPGMDFIVSNENGNTFTVDPNGSERFLAPATDTNGDYLQSTYAGDAFRADVPAAGTARVLYNEGPGGWNEE